MLELPSLSSEVPDHQGFQAAHNLPHDSHHIESCTIRLNVDNLIATGFNTSDFIT